ncbi:Zinc finger protein CONSTANS-LIKE 15 [Triticum urartu]|uniref:Zinc finger protein CONSTANS-LIKE 15 n=1 Tax=Triticum urartu TaxID=4572 RepID=M7Z5W9_TRIUA|nr:Zinc finger protein CONSTANS-LIKE 15 [Triticum urartu]
MSMSVPLGARFTASHWSSEKRADVLLPTIILMNAANMLQAEFPVSSTCSERRQQHHVPDLDHDPKRGRASSEKEEVPAGVSSSGTCTCRCNQRPKGYTGCPSVGELAAILGVVVGDKAAEAWWPVWEEPQVLSFDDVIVPTTACHGLQPLLTSSSSPKNRSLPCGELDGEVLRQLGELAKSEEAATEPAGVDQLPPPWGSSDYAAIGHGDIGALGAEAICAAAILHVPPSQQNQEAWIATSCNELPEQVSASSSAEPSLSSFVEVSEVCPGLSRSGSSSVDDMANGGHDHLSPAAAPVAAAPVQAAPGTKNVGGYDVVYPDRGKVISRYKEKRKNRMFGKQIRYESRKARADGRVRTNGRFAKSSQ